MENKIKGYTWGDIVQKHSISTTHADHMPRYERLYGQWVKGLMDEQIRWEKEEIENLIKEADRRGFKKGTKYRIIRNDDEGKVIVHEETAEHRAEHFHTYLDERGVTLYCGQSIGLIYNKGEWAQIYY